MHYLRRFNSILAAGGSIWREIAKMHYDDGIHMDTFYSQRYCSLLILHIDTKFIEHCLSRFQKIALQCFVQTLVGESAVSTWEGRSSSTRVAHIFPKHAVLFRSIEKSQSYWTVTNVRRSKWLTTCWISRFLELQECSLHYWEPLAAEDLVCNAFANTTNDCQRWICPALSRNPNHLDLNAPTKIPKAAWWWFFMPWSCMWCWFPIQMRSLV